MRRFAPYFVVAIFAFLPAAAHAEYIDSFTSDIALHQDSSFTVTETIDYNFGSSTRHGIFRYIPTKHPVPASAWYLTHYIDIHIDSVRRDGIPEPYTEDDQKDQVYLKIGDPNTTISGTHTYTVTYDVHGGLSYFKNGGAELYWNVTGNSWEVPMRTTGAVVTAPPGVLTGEQSCYAGVEGDQASCVHTTATATSTRFVGGTLGKNAGLTFAVAVDRSKIAEVVLERTPLVWVWGIGIVLWFLGLGWFIYSYKTANRTGGPIIAEYEPYENVKPMYTGVLFDGRLDPRDITAGIVYLAQKGYLKIKKTERKVMFLFEVDDYEVTLAQVPDDSVSNFEQEVLSMLFRDTSEAGQSTTLSSLKADTAKQRENQQTLTSMKKALEKDLVAEGYYQEFASWHKVIVGVIIVLSVGILGFDHISFSSVPMQVWALGITIVASGIIVVLALYRRRTKKGYEALDHLEGFRLFLSVTDEERMEFHNAPEKSPEQFMKYLPYAIAFGVEKKWAKVFKDITIPNPEWYDGGASAASFSAVNLTTSLGAFSTAFASSSGSSVGASGGGGFSGGGGGGGGGGSW